MCSARNLQAGMPGHKAGENERMHGTVYRWLDFFAWNRATLKCLVGAFLMLTGMLGFTSFFWRPLVCLIPSVGCEWNGPDFLLLGALIIAPIGIFVGVLLVAQGWQVLVDERWLREVRRGIVTVRDLRPGVVYPPSGTQALTCRFEIQVEGMDIISADYWSAVGPADVLRLVDGAAFACEISLSLPTSVRLWLLADPHAGELTGRCLNFAPVKLYPVQDKLVGPMPSWDWPRVF